MALKNNQSLIFRVLISVVAIVMGVSWMHDAAIEERVITLRYLMLGAAGFISFVTPYLLFPDSKSKLIQLGNISGRKLIIYLFNRTFSYYLYFYLFILATLFADSISAGSDLFIKSAYSVYALLFITGLHCFALYLYLKVGPQSQFWQESEKGKELRFKLANYFKYPMDPGAIPSLVNTVVLALFGMLFIIVSTIVGNSMGFVTEAALSIVVFLIGGVVYIARNRKPERKYYHTNSFFSEFFGASQGEDTITARREVGQLWWVPSPIRVNVWQYLQQIDRKIPAGRAVAAGHVLVWLVAYQKPDINFMVGIWTLFAITHHLFILLTMQRNFSPHWMLRWLSPIKNWVFSWFWMQVRWLLPLIISMNAQLFVFGIPRSSDQLFIIVVYLLSALAVASVGGFRLKKSIL
ncbi:MAG TPA: hypothetical protein VKM36_01760 [Balneolaceae bacterium]|nr:hypothetical protein [Balneolaceae bacterium]